MKAFGLILKIVAALVFLTVITIGILLTVIDPNDYRDEITVAVKEHTGRDLSVANMSLDIFPRISVNLEKAALSNAQGFSDQPFVAVDKVQIGAAILPLLSKKLEVETLTLHGLNLNLEKDAEGKTNWDDLTANEATAPEEEKQENQENHSNPLSQLSSLNFGGIDIQNGEVSWKDAQNQQTVQLTDLNLSTGSITFGEFFDVTLNAKTTIKEPEMQSTIKVNLLAKLEQSGAYAVKDLTVENSTTGKGLPVEQLQTKISLATFDLTANKLSLPELQLDIDVTGGADFPLTSIKAKTRISELSGDLSKQTFMAKSVALESDLSGDVIPEGKTQLSLNTPFELDLIKQTAKLSNIAVKSMDLNIKANVYAETIIDAPMVKADIDLAAFNLRKLLNEMKISLPEMSDSKTLQTLAASLKLQFQQKSQALKIKDLAVKLDDSKLNGEFGLSNFSHPAVTYNLALDQINLNRYLPNKQTSTEPQPAKSEATDAKIELPVEELRKLNIDGTMKVGKLVYDKLTPTNILVTTKAANGDININPIRADIFKTRANAQAGLNVASDKPKYRFKTDTKNLPIGEVLIAFTGDDRISGTGTLNADITTSGERVSEFKQALNGRVSANLKDGAVKGFNLAQAIRTAKAKISGKSTASSDTEEKTDFSELIAAATIKNGVVTTETLSAKAPFMRIDGSGTVNLPKETLKYLVKTKIVASDKGQGGEDLKDLNGLTIPVKLTGSYMNPDIALDLESLLEQKAKAEIEKKKEEVIEDVKKKAQDKLKDSILKGFKF